MIYQDEYGTYGHSYKCPCCEKDHGVVYHHITEQLPILCKACLDNDATDTNLRLKTLIYYIGILQGEVEDIDNITTGLRVLK